MTLNRTTTTKAPRWLITGPWCCYCCSHCTASEHIASVNASTNADIWAYSDGFKNSNGATGAGWSVFQGQKLALQGQGKCGELQEVAGAEAIAAFHAVKAAVNLSTHETKHIHLCTDNMSVLQKPEDRISDPEASPTNAASSSRTISSSSASSSESAGTSQSQTSTPTDLEPVAAPRMSFVPRKRQRPAPVTSWVWQHFNITQVDRQWTKRNGKKVPTDRIIRYSHIDNDTGSQCNFHETTKPMSAANLQRLGSRLSELSHVSISGPATSQAKYISTYPNSLLGRHFKEIVQLGAFALDDLPIGNDLFRLWRRLKNWTSKTSCSP